ncbi:MAG: hypothetical protein GY809_25510 [Planctomycetes bacterium]|nr:hypothetical protein [Planctomycetota bacterium]
MQHILRNGIVIEAPISKYTRNSLVVGMIALVGFGLYCIYDGYFNKAFIEKYTKDGKPDATLLFNRKSPPVLFVAAALLAGRWVLIRKRKVLALDTELVINGKIHIPYDAIEQIDKTLFKKKGLFVITYALSGKQCHQKLSDNTYDNMEAILDHLVAQIS